MITKEQLMENKPDYCPVCGNILPVDTYLTYPDIISIYLNKLIENEIDNIRNGNYEPKEKQYDR